MRKVIVCFVILLAATLASSGAPPDRLPNLVAPAEARGLMMVGGGVPVAGGSCPADDAPDLVEDTTAGGGLAYLGYNTGGAFYGQTAFNPGANKSLCKLGFYVYDIAGGAGINAYSYTAAVYTLSGNNLGVLQGTSTAKLGSTLTGSAWAYFTFSTPVALTSGTDYCLVITVDTFSTSNYIRLSYAAGTETAIDGGVDYWDSGGSYQFIGAGSTTDVLIKIYWYD